MEHLYVTVICGDTAAHAERVFDDLRLKSINQIKDGMLGRLGNFKTYTYIFEIPEEEVVDKRKKLMKALIGESAEWRGMLRCLCIICNYKFVADDYLVNHEDDDD